MKKTVTFFRTRIRCISFFQHSSPKCHKSFLRSITLLILFTCLTANNVWSGTTTITLNKTTTGYSGSSYTTTESTVTAATSGSIDLKLNNWIGNTSNIQPRGNQATITSDFYLYNTTAILGNITAITVTGTNLINSKINLITGTSAVTSSTGGTAGGSSTTTGTSASWTVTGNNNYFRVQFLNGGTSGTASITTIVITYSDPTPTITSPTPTSLSGFTTTTGAASTSQTFTIGGSNLTANLVVTAPTDYEVRENGTGTFGSSVSFTPSSGTVATKTIEVRIAASAGAGTPSGNIACTSTGSTTQNVAVSGTVNSALSPIITATGTINAFANTVINTTSAEQSYTLQGSNLTGNITVTPPAGFEISKTSGSGFVANPSTLIFTPAEIASAQNVYVRFAPTAAQAYSGNITHTSTGATQVDKALSGTGIKAEPTNHATSFTATANSSTQITVTWTDATGGQTPDGYLVKASATSPTAPSDGTAETDATLVKNIAQGTQTAVFTGLSASTTYNFSIWPYTNSGSSINYKTDGTVPTASATTETPLGIAVASSASDVTASGFTANWSATAGATGYDVNVYTKTAGATATDLFISEYGEGSSNNKYIEIFNGTGSYIDLSNYTLKQSINGGGWDVDLTYTLPLSGILANNDVYVITNSTANQSILDKADLILTYSTSVQGARVASFTGNDAIGLFKNSVLIDVFGVPTSNSTIPVAGFSTYGQDHTIVRKSTIVSGNTNWTNSSGTNTTDSEWIGYASDTWTYLGSHTLSGGSTNTPISGSPFSLANVTSKSVTGLAQGTNYYYTVVAKNASTSTSASNEISVTTLIPTFSGTGDWAETARWNTASVPASTQNVILDGDATINSTVALYGLTINSGKSLTVAAGKQLTISNSLSNNGTIILQSNATGTATLLTPSSISGSGTATVQQFLTGVTGSAGRGWWYVSSPISNATSAVFNPAGGTYKFGYWDEPTFSYPQILDNATSLATGKGYIFYNPTADATISFNGTLNTGDITINPSRTGTVDGARGFNLVGNPYPSFLDWNAATKTNVRSTIWYRTWSAGGSMTFDTFDGTVGTGNGINGNVNRYIPPMQAFWVKVNADGDAGAITFHNADRSHQDQTNSNNRLKTKSSENSTIVRLRVSNGTNSDEAILVGDVNASNAFDNYDSPKMKVNNTEIPEIFTVTDQQELVINHLNSITNNTELPLGFRPGKTADFTITATEITNLDSNLKLFLKDNNNEYELTNGNSYSFSSDATASTSRFSIIFKSNSTVTSTATNTNGNNVLISSNKMNGISITIQGDNNSAKAVVYDIMGKELLTKSLKAGLNNLPPMTAGVYIVKVSTNTGTTEHKVVIK